MHKAFEIILSVIVAIFPALAIYNFLPGTNLAFFLLLIVCIPLLIFREKLDYNYDEVVFLFCIVLVSVLSCLLHLMLGVVWFDFALFFHNMYSIFICLLPLCFVTKNLDVNIFVRTVLVFGVVSSIVLIWQWFSYFFSGSFQADVFLPWFEIKRDLESFSQYRPSAFFTEPAHFAIYMLPAFQIALLYRFKVLSYLFAVSILCSGSSTGVVLLSVLLTYHVYMIGSQKRYAAVVAFVVVVVSYFIVDVVFPNVLYNNFEKLSSVRDGSSSGRLFGPLMYIPLLQMYEHVFGITLNQLSNFLMVEGNFGPSESLKNYANALIYMYISYGLIGFVTILVYFKRKFRAIKQSYGFLLIFIGVFCSDQILFNGNYFYLLSFVLMTEKIYINNLSLKKRFIQKS